MAAMNKMKLKKNKEIHSTFSRLAGVESQKPIRSVVRENLKKTSHDSPTKETKQTVHFQYRNIIKFEIFGDQHFLVGGFNPFKKISVKLETFP